ncbi:MAG: AzlD domain-containing protein [Anaerolineae bacterium]|nr:AzlD domain-containing protein [Anaerolineae bacterium]
MTPIEWVMILGMLAVTLGIRYFPFALASRTTMPPLMEAALQYVPPAVLVAITVPAVLLPRGEWWVSWTNPYLVAALVSTLAGILTRNLLATIAIGLVVFFAFQMILG